MNKIVCFIFSILIGFASHAQAKRWTIQECVAYALKNNISIKQSVLDADLAKIDKNNALASFLPSINADASHSWNIGLNQNITTGILENQTTQFSAFGLNTGVDIYKGLQNQNRLRKSNLQILASQYNLDKMKEDISLYVANAFLQILFDKENIKVQKEQLEISEKQYIRTDELVKAGSIPRGDLLDIKATVASNKQKVVSAENAFIISKLSLVQLLQLDDFENFDIADVEYGVADSPTMLLGPQAIFQKAKEIRVELKIAKSNLEIAERDLKIARGGFQLSLQGFYRFNTRISYADVPVFDSSGKFVGFRNPNPFFNQFSDNKGHNFGMQLNIPILNGFSVKNSVERSKVSIEKNKLALSQSELDLERNVFKAFTDVKGALNAYESAIIALDARKEAFNYASEKLAVGIMNAFDFNQSQTLLSNSQSEVLRTKYDYIFKVKVLELYFGIPIIQKQ